MKRLVLSLLLFGVLSGSERAAYSQKVALLAVSLDTPQEQWEGVRNMLQNQGYTVTWVVATRWARIEAAIQTLATASQQQAYQRFVFYFRGHGSDNGGLTLCNGKGDAIETANTSDRARAILSGIVSESYTFVFDSCFAADNIPIVASIASQMASDPVGYTIAACGGDPRAADKGYTYDTEFGKALEACLSSLPPGSAWTELLFCVHGKRFTGPGVNPTISKPGMGRINPNQPADVPVF